MNNPIMTSPQTPNSQLEGGILCLEKESRPVEGYTLIIPFIHPHPRSKPKDGFVSRHFNRWISSPVSEILLRTPVVPNQVSLAIALMAIPMIVAGALGHLLIVAVLWQLISIFDGIDGEIARAKGLSTRFGGLLDTVLDYLIDSLGALAIGLAVVSRRDIPFSIILSVVCITIAVRLITNFVAKSVSDRRHHLILDNRDMMVLLVLTGAIITEFTEKSWVMIATLLFASVIRLNNCIFRMILYYIDEHKAPLNVSQSIVLFAPDSTVSSEHPLTEELLPNDTGAKRPLSSEKPTV